MLSATTPHSSRRSGLLPLLTAFSSSSPSRADAQKNDVSFPNATVTTLAFGSCHRNKYISKERGIIWDAIRNADPDAFLWTGDAIYPPTKMGTASIEALANEYEQMLTNRTIGYSEFVSDRRYPPFGVHGTWDDHDYGGNDRGHEMPQRNERRDAFLKFLNVPPNDGRYERDGVYNSVSFGEGEKKVKVLFLDTRWGRERHCIPSVGGSGLPLGAIVACITRWIAAGLNLSRVVPSCRRRRVLSPAQWSWLEDQLEGSDAAVHIIVSSIQVLTTNPVVESWGHYVDERDTLIRTLSGTRGLVLLSGDVHHGEILDVGAGYRKGRTYADEGSRPGNDAAGSEAKGGAADDGGGAFLEVTSSGLTHSCVDPFYGPLCSLILESFPAHRYRPPRSATETKIPGLAAERGYFTGRNFGTVRIDWAKGTVDVHVHDATGLTVLSTGPRAISRSTRLTEAELAAVAPCTDRHLLPWVRSALALAILVSALSTFLMKRWRALSVPRPSGRKGPKAH